MNIAEEMKEPSRTLPRALFLTLGLTALLYAVVVWIAVTAVPPQELARSSAPLALVLERLTGLPLVTMSAIAIVATLNGVIVHMIMIARVIYGLADRGSLPKSFARLNNLTRTPLIATVIAVGTILVLALAVPLAGLADLTASLTLVIFAVVNLALMRIKSRNDAPPLGAFVCPRWVPFAGLASSVLLLALDLIVGYASCTCVALGQVRARRSTAEAEGVTVVRRIDALFEIERSINGKSPEERIAVRQT